MHGVERKQIVLGGARMIHPHRPAIGPSKLRAEHRRLTERRHSAEPMSDERALQEVVGRYARCRL